MSATVLREINKTNAEDITRRLENARENSQVPGPPEIPQEDDAANPSLKNLLFGEGRDRAPTLDSFIEKEVQESPADFEDGDRGEDVN